MLWFQNSWLWLFSSLRSWHHFVSSSVCVFMAVANMLKADACCWKATTKSRLVCRFASSSWLFISRSRVRRSSRSIETGTGSILSPAVGSGPLIGPLPWGKVAWPTLLCVGVGVGASDATECCVMSFFGRDPEAMVVATRHSGIELKLGSSGTAIPDMPGAAHGVALGSPDPRLPDLFPSNCDTEVTTLCSCHCVIAVAIGSSVVRSWLLESCADDFAGAAASIAGGVMDLLSELFLSVCDLEVAAVCSCRCGNSGHRVLWPAVLVAWVPCRRLRRGCSLDSWWCDGLAFRAVPLHLWPGSCSCLLLPLCGDSGHGILWYLVRHWQLGLWNLKGQGGFWVHGASALMSWLVAFVQLQLRGFAGGHNRLILLDYHTVWCLQARFTTGWTFQFLGQVHFGLHPHPSHRIILHLGTGIWTAGAGGGRHSRLWFFFLSQKLRRLFGW